MLLMVFISCQKREISVYESGRYVQFTKVNTDTTNFSFFFYGGRNEVTYAIPVKLIGTMPSSNISYRIEVDEKISTAPSSIYSFDNNQSFRMGIAQDTVYITFKNQSDLLTNTYMLALKIVENNEVKPGQTNYSTRVFKINDIVVQPSWWTGDMITRHLGVYSEKKFRVFMQATGEGDLSIFTPAEQRIHMLKFKYYLIEQKDKGTPVLMEDGRDMLSTVPLIG